MTDRRQRYQVDIQRDAQGEPQRLLYAAVASQPGSKVTLMTTDSDITTNAAAYTDGTLSMPDRDRDIRALFEELIGDILAYADTGLHGSVAGVEREMVDYRKRLDALLGGSA